MKDIIIVTPDSGNPLPAYRFLTDACRDLGVPYNTLRKKRLPLHFKGYYWERRPLK